MAKSLDEINCEYMENRNEFLIPNKFTDLNRDSKRGNIKVSTVFSNLIFYGAIILLLFAAVTVSAGEASGAIMGYRYYHILTSSMERVYPSGSLVIVKDVDKEEIHIGDDITFYTDPETVVTHRVVDIVEDYDGNGARGYQTQGTESLNPDPDLTHEANVAGKVVYSVPKLGLALDFAREHMIFVLGMFLTAILLSFLVRVIYHQYRYEMQEG